MAAGPDDAWLLALGAKISDGAQVDWDDAERHADDPAQRELIQQLRRVADIVHSTRAAGHLPPRAGRRQTPASSGATPWLHLVLFECIGSGAFGSVYRGWDPVLDRDVAVKLLSTARSVRGPLEEARHLARVRHPHVVVVHGADETPERAGIWMEFIDGLTLADLVRERGPMSAREALGIGLDLCSALSAIHAAGLLHRDIKAQNVMREIGGRIVLMDFSGAQAVAAGETPERLSGTPLYMAPELFGGTAPSPASDVYSLGALLFYLLSGSLPVEGETFGAVRDAHARGERRRLRDVRADLPDGLVSVVERATDPDPNMRFRTAGELEHALAGAAGVPVAPGVPPPGLTARPLRMRWVAAAAALGVVTVAAAVAAVLGASAPRPAAPLVRFTIGPPLLAGSWPRVSPDGGFVVYGAPAGDGRPRLWVRPLDSPAARPLMATTATETPFWSPDSAAIGFFEDGKLKRIGLDENEAQVLADAPSPHGGDWFGDTILYSRVDGIYRVSAHGGAAEQVTTLDREHGEYAHGWPKFLPDGRRFLYVARSADSAQAGVFVRSLAGGPARRILPAFSRTTYADGFLFYVRDGALLAHPFDPGAAVLRGEPRVLAGNVAYHASNDAAFDVSPSGLLIYHPRARAPSSRLVLFDRRGREVAGLTQAGWFDHPSFSRGGQYVAAESTAPDEWNPDIWVYDLSRRSATRLTREAAPDISPVWAPDGRRLAFSSKREGVYDVFVSTLDAVDNVRTLVSTPGDKIIEDWSPDGQYLIASVRRSGLWLMPLGANASARPQLLHADGPGRNWQAEFSPDGRWLSYTSSESGRAEVYVEPFPATGERWQISTAGGTDPHWRGDARELFFLDATSVIMAAAVADTPGAATPRPLFRVSPPDIADASNFTVSPDGQQFVVNTFVAHGVVEPIQAVLNWKALAAR